MTNPLHRHGFDERWAVALEALAHGRLPARVVSEHKGECRVVTTWGDLPAFPSGRLLHEATSREELPAVGDFVAIAKDAGDDSAVIHTVLPRRSLLARKMSGRTTKIQPVAANVDVVFVVSGLDGNFNLRRLERFLAAGTDSGADVVAVMNKTDLCPDLSARLAEAAHASGALEVVAACGKTGEGVDRLRALVPEGVTACFVGSSGVGKSTLLNLLVGSDVAATGAVRDEDAKGRHTTTRREILLVPGGGVVIDTPGLREWGLWDAADGIETVFPEVVELASACRFADCRHATEPGCAVRKALDSGELGQGRYESFVKLSAEQALKLGYRDARNARDRKGREKERSKLIRAVLKKKGKK